MAKQRLYYFTLTTLTIVAGLLSRYFTVIPLFIGDILWATMVYFIMRFLLVNNSPKFAVITSLLFSFAIEFSQLYKAPWINNLRHTLFGRLVLGDTFLMSDLLCYMIGIAIGVWVDRKQLKDEE